MTRPRYAGFSLIEMAIVLLVFGMVLGIAIPAMGRYSDDMALRGATAQMTSALLLTRDRAMASRTARTMLFQAGYSGTDYRVEVGGVIRTGWTLPRRSSYSWLSGTISSVIFTPDGRCSTSGLIILQNTRGSLDTVSVLSSGLVLTK